MAYKRKTALTSKATAQLSAIADIIPQAAPWAAAKHIAIVARRIVPKRTRRLQRSIRAVRLGLRESIVEATAPYAGWVEFGTRKMKARPYLRPAVDSEKSATMRTVVAEVNQEIKRVLKSSL